MGTSIFPALAVVSGSMCIPYGGACDGWTHPFDRTLHIGDIIVIQGTNPEDLNANYPDSDIIVFHRPNNYGELIVHRIVKKEEINGKWYFWTKGDGNGNGPSEVWPNPVAPYQYDPWYTTDPSVPQGGVSEDLVVGKVVMRIPWIGHIAIFMQQALGVNGSFIGVPLIIVLIIILVIIEFAIPVLRQRKKTPEQNATGSPQI
jgi:hypothetical protein